jgi:hypothetical protein
VSPLLVQTVEEAVRRSPLVVRPKSTTSSRTQQRLLYKATNSMNKVCCFILLVSSTHGWVSHSGAVSFSAQRALSLQLSKDKEIPASAGLETDNPCWQNMLDDDCSMGNIYAANFVASKWIKSMPCGEGIEASFAGIMRPNISISDPTATSNSFVSLCENRIAICQ